MNYKNILTEADKSRFIKPIYSDIKSRWNGAVPSEEDLTKFANNGAADKYKVNWLKLANDLDEQDRLIDSYKAWLKNKEADTLKVNMLSVTKADYEAANSPQIAFGKTFNEKDEEFNNVARLLFRAGLNCYGTSNIQINELKFEQKLTESKEKKFHMKAADLAEKISSITDGKDPYDFGLVLVNDDMFSLLRSVKANTDIECILLSNVHWENSFDGYSSVDVDELIDVLRNYPNYDIIYSIDKKPPKYVSEIETSPNEDMVDILIGGDEFFDPLTSATASPLLLN